ncbi:hypothetical protein IGI04_029810 [Brassica rapa subsp. trilocularis]|uniref:Uncharacterized protein n=1 Tax=Brassica rapa subsp. trilocularis TaxID=1813537 RepID=A0ABQ7LP08_BRACM|nr:hypothetical protein IGI04_029810 [Brassica rapa subsp. trilocularis]
MSRIYLLVRRYGEETRRAVDEEFLSGSRGQHAPGFILTDTAELYFPTPMNGLRFVPVRRQGSTFSPNDYVWFMAMD